MRDQPHGQDLGGGAAGDLDAAIEKVLAAIKSGDNDLAKLLALEAGGDDVGRRFGRAGLEALAERAFKALAGVEPATMQVVLRALKIAAPAAVVKIKFDTDSDRDYAADDGVEQHYDEPDWVDREVRSARPKSTAANARLAIEAFGLVCRYDEFHDRKEVYGAVLEERLHGELSDGAILMLRVAMKYHFDIEPKSTDLRDAISQMCLMDRYDPVLQYLDGLVWDGVKRIDTWMRDYLTAPDTEFIRTVSRISLVATVRRARQPGVKFDEIIVLEGPQGVSKSTAIKVLAGDENFSDQHIVGKDSKERQELVRGIWMFEIADMTGMSKTGANQIKAFASATHERARPAYGHERVDMPRRCTFWATTNDSTYLRDDTGNRRFWPIPAPWVHIEALKDDRDQLWAEAAAAEAAGESIRLPPHLYLAAAAEQEKRREIDPWDAWLVDIDTIAARFDVIDRSSKNVLRTELRVGVKAVFGHLKIPADQQSPAYGVRLAAAMRRHGWDKPDRAIRVERGGNPVHGFVKVVTDQQPEDDQEELLPCYAPLRKEVSAAQSNLAVPAHRSGT